MASLVQAQRARVFLTLHLHRLVRKLHGTAGACVTMRISAGKASKPCIAISPETRLVMLDRDPLDHDVFSLGLVCAYQKSSPDLLLPKLSASTETVLRYLRVLKLEWLFTP